MEGALRGVLDPVKDLLATLAKNLGVPESATSSILLTPGLQDQSLAQLPGQLVYLAKNYKPEQGQDKPLVDRIPSADRKCVGASGGERPVSEVIAQTTRWWIGIITEQEKIESLVSDAELGKDYSDQVNAFESLLGAVDRWEPGSYVVTGYGGTGKSTVLRALAERLAAQFLEPPTDRPRPFPLLMSLKHVSLADKLRDRFRRHEGSAPELWEAIATSWGHWASGVMQRMSEETGKPAAKLEDNWSDFTFTGKTVLMIDSLDEFLSRYDEITIDDLEKLGEYLRFDGETEIPNPLVLIFCGRVATEDWDRLASNPLIRIGLLSRPAAARFISEADVERLLKGLDGKEEESLVLRPLILNAFKLRPKWQDIENPIQIIESALEVLVDTNALHNEGSASRQKQADQWDGKPVQERMGAITAVGWAFTENKDDRQTVDGILDNLSFDEILTRTALIAQEWRSEPTATSDPRVNQMIEGFRLAADKHMLRALLRRSVFQYTGKYSFAHRVWMETCIARYVAFSIERHRFEALRTRTYYPSIFRRIGGLLQTPVDDRLVNQAIDSAPRTQFVIGNIAAIIGRSLVEVEASGLRRLADRLQEIGPLARHVLIGSLGCRAATRAARDTSRDAILNVLYPNMLERCITNCNLPDGNPATASLAWCYYKLLGQSENRHHDSFPWPIPAMGDESAVFQMSCPGFIEEHGVGLKGRSLQSGYVEAIRLAASAPAPHRLIAAIHYVLMLVICQKRGASVGRTDSELGGLFDRSRGGFAEQLQKVEEVPELFKLFDLAGKIYRRETWVQ
ncbi:MAG: AAA family ATPase [Acetobacteraceae bacterium]